MPDERLTYEVVWYSGGPEYAPNRVIGRDRIKRYSLDGAILWACNHMKANKSENARLAQGFYVQHIEVVI